MNFSEIFEEISLEDIYDNVYHSVGKLTGHDFYTITAGKKGHYNSMVGSGGGLGLFFQKPATWTLLRSDRYTLEMIQKEKTYTISYFPKVYKDEVFFFADTSGRDSKKMDETDFTPLETPSGEVVFEEARLIIECKLLTLTTVTPEDLQSQGAKDFVKEEYKEKSHYRKIAFGEITKAWKKL